MSFDKLVTGYSRTVETFESFRRCWPTSSRPRRLQSKHGQLSGLLLHSPRLAMRVVVNVLATGQWGRWPVGPHFRRSSSSNTPRYHVGNSQRPLHNPERSFTYRYSYTSVLGIALSPFSSGAKRACYNKRSCVSQYHNDCFRSSIRQWYGTICTVFATCVIRTPLYIRSAWFLNYYHHNRVPLSHTAHCEYCLLARRQRSRPNDA